MFINRLVEEVLEDDYFLELYEKTCQVFTRDTFNFKHDRLSKKELKDILRFADILSNSELGQARNKSYRILSLLKIGYGKEEIFKIYSNAILKKLANFPTLKNIEEIKLPIDREIDHLISKSKLEIPMGKGHFTPVQHKIYNMMKNNMFFSFSGPTSMGKSFLIKEFVIDTIKNNKWVKGFCIIVPTKALIKQYTIDINNLLKEYEIKTFNVLTTPNILDFVEFEHEKFIFILTPERLLNLLSSKHNFYIDYLIVDEAHKLFEDSDRALTYYTSIDYCIGKFRNMKTIISSPLIENPDIYGDIYWNNDIATYKTKESPVTQNLFLIDCINKKLEFYDENNYVYDIKNISYLNSTNSILYTLGSGSALVYLNSYIGIIESARQFCDYLEKNELKITTKKEDEHLEELCELVKNNVHPKYYLIDCLKYGVGFHFGRLPIVIRERVELLFKKGIIKFLFCTNTLLEGVNLPAKNIFILADKVGTKEISKIDFWNLAGRAGRLGYEFYGNIFCIKNTEQAWKNSMILKKGEISAANTINNKITKSKRTIKKIIIEEEIKPTLKKEKRYLSYAANIIQIDSISQNNTSIIKEFRNIDEKTIDVCKSIKNNVNIEVLNASKSIDIKVQNNVLENLFINKMPREVTKEKCLYILNNMHRLYRWDIKESRLKNNKSLSYIALLMTKWINDTPLNRIILESIQFNSDNRKDLFFRGKSLGKFDKNNSEHINTLINGIINEIEDILRFDLEKYFNHYYLLLKSKYGDEGIGYNWASYLEFGTRNNKNIVLQNSGFSRYSANILLSNYKEYLNFDKDILIGIDKRIMETDISSNIIAYNELILWFK